MTDQETDAPGHIRTPPSDLDAEQCVLGGMLLSADAIGDVLDLPLAGNDFYKPAHETIFAAILDLHSRSEPADAVTVGALLAKSGDLNHIGGGPYLHTLINSVPTAANAGYYADIVKELAVLRRLGEAGTRIVQMSYVTDRSDAATVVDLAAAEIQAVTGDTRTDGVTTVADEAETFLEGLLDNTKPRNYLPTPYRDFRDAVPIEGGDMVVVAGDTGMGKSVVMVDFVRHAAIECRKRTLLVSIEMNADQLMQRMFAAEAKVPLHHLRGDVNIDDFEQKRLGKAAGRILDAPIDMIVDGTVTLGRIRSTLRRMQARHMLPELVVIDYLQILTPERETGNRTIDVGALSRGIKRIAMDFRIPVIVGAQLNRQLNGRTDKRPVLSDLRESGSIGQDANIVVLLYREDYYERESPRAGELELIVAKNRQGPLCNITIGFQGHYSRALDMAQT
ncbi:DnaB domain protein helicase domain protein [Catenulispora acidiphila DSM 44928]|uniref:Replicative DNA helicase DnaB n=1 Tax=Catenulispora acidiphila (strain DSM 44928 / JCM 14897 / NBRC 102108 / NRRL B-24433 / ID139908) TaxID=479433 RepID=C7Q2R2_CATAD|nr:replicative DNA helicase [Catenulispora acidiphila]ACU71804.1 DnaB domain protein helicase domain protein [Catenulispora acidiphila DSM 44928]